MRAGPGCPRQPSGLSLRSRTARTRSVPNSSMQPAWTPARTTGSPRHRPERRRARRTTGPCPSSRPPKALVGSFTPPSGGNVGTARPLNPSLRSSSSASSEAPTRIPGAMTSRIVVVWGGGSRPATWSGGQAEQPRRPRQGSAQLRTRRRLNCLGVLGTHGNLPSGDSGQCNTENARQWALLPSRQQAQHLV